MRYDRKNLKWNGWGWHNEHFDQQELSQRFWQDLQQNFGLDQLSNTPSIDLEDVRLPAVKLKPEVIEALNAIVGAEGVKLDRFERIFHAKGRSYYDLLRLRQGHLEFVPDVVVYPETSEQIQQILALAQAHQLALIPFGGGSSVVGGVEATRSEEQKGIITLDMTHMTRLLGLDKISLTATFQAGIYGPELEETLQRQGYTLGHYPQSFEFSTLGGWIAARSAGQQSDRYGKTEEFLLAAQVVTPAGEWRTLPFPASAAGPDLKHLIAGSEGIFGVITEATVKIHPQPPVREYWGVLFRDFTSGSDAIRELMQTEAPLAMIRLSDEDETHFFSQVRKKKGSLVQQAMKKVLKLRGFGPRPCLMIFGLEGEQWKVYAALPQIMAVCVRYGGFMVGKHIGESWYQGRFKMPYLRDRLMDRGIGVDTLETATEWNNIPRLHRAVKNAIREKMTWGAQHGIVMAHVSHSYHDGASLYFTFAFPMQAGQEISQWWEIKKAASEAIVTNGGTISHHHGVGTDHAPWLAPEKGELGMGILKATKAYFDPQGIMNPGKLLVEPKQKEA